MDLEKEIFEIINKLEEKHSLTLEEYKKLIEAYCDESREILKEKAVVVRKQIYGNDVFIRGLIEFSNICKNNCLYCGIRRGNKNCNRYRLSKKDILHCASQGYDLGFRTFVLQSGEDVFFTDEVLCDIVSEIKKAFPDCAITLSVGERSFESYKKLFEAGAERYLLRHETADEEHYKKLHPAEMSFKNRMECLSNLRKIGFAVGAGFMVGSPFQTNESLAKDLKFIEEFQPEMCGIGPFIPHKDTEFANFKAGSADFTCYLLSIIRLIKPNVLLPSTTALGTVNPNGREMGIMSGANVVMPNLSPVSVRKDYSLYDNKLCTGEESATCKACLARRIESTGYQVVVDRGDIRPL